MAFPHDGKKFAPGESGNPAGYPTGVPNRATVLKRLLELEYEIDNPIKEGERIKVTVEEAAAWGLVQKAASGDVQAYKEVMDSVYGKQTDKVQVETTRKITRKIGGRTPPPTDEPSAGT
jgi:hypothetical protein